MPETATKKATKGIDLYEFLRSNGYKIPDREELSWGEDSILSVASSDNIHVGRIYKTSDKPVKYKKIKIVYFQNAAQIEEVLKFKEFLEKNNIKYIEQNDKKSISSIASDFRKNAEKLNSLADRLEGKL